jgi:hypothetical protein
MWEETVEAQVRYYDIFLEELRKTTKTVHFDGGVSL